VKKEGRRRRKENSLAMGGGVGDIEAEKNIAKNLSLTRRCFQCDSRNTFHCIRHANIFEPFFVCRVWVIKKVLVSQMRTVNYLSRVTCTNISIGR
jgi:hypothetical protein